MKSLIKECIELGLFEEAKMLLEDFASLSKFSWYDLSEEEQQGMYELVTASYTQAVGHAWAFDKFAQRAGNWAFYGSINMASGKTEGGFVAVRTNGDMGWKLVMSAGQPLTQAKGMRMMVTEAESKNEAIWGVVTQPIKDSLVKYKDPIKKTPVFISAPGALVKKAIHLIPAWEFGDADLDIASDGSIEYRSADMKSAIKKFFVANRKFYMDILEKGIRSKQFNLGLGEGLALRMLLGLTNEEMKSLEAIQKSVA